MLTYGWPTSILISKGAFKCISPLEYENCNFESKYLRIKTIIDAVSVETGKCKTETPIWLSQLKTNVKVGWSLVTLKSMFT